jgi:RNA polymerase sigma factor (sigma-70 family)
VLLGLAVEPQRAQLATWIWSTSRNKVIDQRRRERMRASTSSEDAARLLSFVAGPEEGFIASAAKSWVNAALAQLTPIQRDVVCLREIDGANYREIADALEITEEAARSAHYRGMERLRLYAQTHDP